VLNNLVGKPESAQISNLFEELEAEEARKRKVGVLKVEEHEHVKKQMALAQAEREKAEKLQQQAAMTKKQEAMAVVIQTNTRQYLARREVRRRRREVKQISSALFLWLESAVVASIRPKA
jgi:hypothetical protein